MKNDFRKLSQITGLALDQARTRMAALRKSETALNDQLAELNAARSARASSREGDDPAYRAGADLNWLRWIDTRKRAINAERARIAAQIENEKAALSKSFGRDKVAQEIAQQLQKTKR